MPSQIKKTVADTVCNLTRQYINRLLAYINMLMPMTEENTYKCNTCGFKGTREYFPTSSKTQCKKCKNSYARRWYAVNAISRREYGRQLRYKNNGVKPMSENKNCAYFLGVHVAERILAHVFNDVIKMPLKNPGYDLICNKGKKIDVKSACLQNMKRSNPRWYFNIKQNKIADYFLCLAFDNRSDLNPLYMWLLPGHEFNTILNASIGITTINKWDKYALDINNVKACCDMVRK